MDFRLVGASLAGLTGLVASAAQAVQIDPIRYDMRNGESGTYTYHDETYTGSGNKAANGAALSGGVGDLTDGVVATQNWIDAEIAPNGPYVGWFTFDPTITFYFSGTPTINRVVFHFDDPNGLGGVMAPAGVTVDGVAQAIADPAGSAPFAVEVTGLNIVASSFDVGIQRRGSNIWIMLSEVEFFGDAVAAPTPGVLPLLAVGAAGLAGLARRRAA
ncbi:MAG: PEP-CTERM sorting domain-containing protein [Alphaproteobacteria bacterium]|nr:PEP-CTERM sorting domain-containing protein [Alphaproteobacteria bacterium]MCB9928336.1 PEP-CTERM sorting domain-containing protein [Alphaproteobacteria bacterium]